MSNIFNPPSQFDSPVEYFESRRTWHPIERDPTHFIQRRVYRQNVATYVPPNPEDMAMPGPGDLPDTFLVRHDILERIGNLITFYQDFANLPTSGLRLPDTFTYEFIGFADPESRPRETDTVNSEIQYDYFVLGVSQGISKLADVPVIGKQKYYSRFGAPRTTEFLTQGAFFGDTDPTRDAYIGWVNDSSKFIVAEDSQRDIYLGPIIERRTTYIRPQ